MSFKKVPDVIAAVDLGSNSFHMVVARHTHGQLIIVDRLRETVRLAAGLDKHGRLQAAAKERALACLQRFGQRLRDMRAKSVRVVGTNTFRHTKQKSAFVDRARVALGHPIEVISGMEEARLIYLGVAQTSPRGIGRRLVVDIGGGSTELILGNGVRAQQMESLQLGCVDMSARYFASGNISAKQMQKARIAVRMELESIRENFIRMGWDDVMGSSGTIQAVQEIIRARSGKNTITATTVAELLELVAHSRHIEKLRLPGLTADRAPVFAGGLVILHEIIQTLSIKTMRVAHGALREGLLYDLLGRYTDEDARICTVRAMQLRYHVDVAQASRVETCALNFLQRLQKVWKLEHTFAPLALSWAAQLHEIGLDISHSQYQRHGAYLLEYADMPGFPREEQMLLACLVGAHRRKLNGQVFDHLNPPWQVKAELLIVILRLAVLLHRGRSKTALPTIKLFAKARTLELVFPTRWLKAKPLTFADLEQEAQFLKAINFKLRFR